MNTQVPAWLEEAPPANINDDLRSGLGFGSPPFISIEDQRFTKIDADGNTEDVGTYDKDVGGPFVDVMIVDTNSNKSRTYYSQPYVKGSGVYNPPDCWSDNGLAPSANAARPIWPVCATCPKAEWGSATSNFSGQGIPACREYKKIAIVHATKFEPDEKGNHYDNMLFLMRIPPNSHKHLRAYVDTVGKRTLGNRRLTVTDIVTRIYFESQGTLRFKPIGYIDQELAGMRKRAWDEDATAAMVGRNDVPISLEKQKAIAAQGGSSPTVAARTEGASPTEPSPAGTAPSLSQKAIATRNQGNRAAPAATQQPAQQQAEQQPAQTRKGRPGKPKTVVAPPKDALDDYPDMPDSLKRNLEAEQEQEGREAAQSQGNFGVDDKADAPPAGMEAELDKLFGEAR